MVLEFPKQFRVGIDATKGLKIRKLKHTSHLVVCGMGGSALPGAMLHDLHRNDPRLRKRHLHVTSHRDYGLPPEATNSRAVIAAMSYSGNTEETISSYLEARRQNLARFVITTDGTLARLARSDRIATAIIPKGVEPRFSAGYQLGALLGFSIKLGLLPSLLKKEMRELENTLEPGKLITLSSSLVNLFHGKRRTPIIYGSSSLSAAVYSWKTNIHENTKLPASYHVLPELNHNELNSFTPLTQTHKDAHKHLFVIMLEDQNERPQTKKRFRLTAQIIKKTGIPVKRVEIKGENALTRIVTANLLGLAFSGVLAERLGINPLPVPVIEDFKKKLR